MLCVRRGLGVGVGGWVGGGSERGNAAKKGSRENVKERCQSKRQSNKGAREKVEHGPERITNTGAREKESQIKGSKRNTAKHRGNDNQRQTDKETKNIKRALLTYRKQNKRVKK